MKRKLFVILSMLALTLTVGAQEAEELTPAFPGAEGYARYITGGRGGKVLHVKNLNDTGAYSLRWCLQQTGAKIIVFDVSGTIHLSSALTIPSNTTIAGQSAPGDGICVADYPVSVGGNNVIVRYMRFRLGNKNVTVDGADGWDGFGGFDHQEIMIDHCSVSWSIDECCSFLGNKNTTVQWCLVSQSLVNAGHSKGAHGYGGNWGGSGASFHHNLLVHHGSRTPRLGPRPTTQLDERVDYRNNVIYNFGGNGCYGGEGMKVNIVNNYYKPGPGSPTGTKGMRIAGIGVRTNSYITTYPDYAPALHLWGKYYVTGNVNSKYGTVTTDNWTNGIYNQIDASSADGTYTQATKDSIKIDEPIPFVATTTHSANDAYSRVLNYAGASLSRDSHDALMVNDARNSLATYTGSGLSKGFINSQDDNKPANAASDWSAWPTLTQTGTITDTDGDGIPDEWEEANGLDPKNQKDGLALNDEGYMMVEVYLNSLVDDITTLQNDGGEMMGTHQYKEINDDGTEPGKSILTSGSIVWPFTEDATTVSIDNSISSQIASTNIAWGANLTNNGIKAVNSVNFIQVQPTISKEALGNEDNAVKFSVTVADGYFFRPSNISFKASKLGTSGGKLDVVWHNSNGEYDISTGFEPIRNNTGNGYSNYSKSVAIGSTAGTSSLYIHVYALDNKAVGLSNITITGDILQTASDGISHVTRGVVGRSYYRLDGTQLSIPAKGVNIEVTTLPDGTRQSRKVMIP